MPWTKDKIYYRLEGKPDGPRVILIHGLACLHVDWWMQIKWLRTFCHVAAMDNRGTGYSLDASKDDLSMEALAKDAEQIIEDLKWDSGVHIVGICVGGQICQELADRLPDGVAKSLTLMCTSSNLWGSLPLIIKISWCMIRFNFLPQSDWQTRLRLMCALLFTDRWMAEEEECQAHDGQKVTHLKSYTQTKKLRELNNLNVPEDVKESERFKDTPHADNIPLVPRIDRWRYMWTVFRWNSMTSERLQNIRRKVPYITVVKAKHDNMIREVTSNELVKEIEPDRFVEMDAGHLITIEKHNEVNELLSSIVTHGKM